jgi:hypothetical protein
LKMGKTRIMITEKKRPIGHLGVCHSATDGLESAFSVCIIESQRIMYPQVKFKKALPTIIVEQL